MSMTLAVKNLPKQNGGYQHFRGPVFIAGWLWLDADGAKLFDWESGGSVPLCDTEACVAMRACLPPPGEYLGGALLQVWVRESSSGPELYDAHWVDFFDPGGEFGVVRWGMRVFVRPVPPQYDSSRPPPL